MLTSTGDLDKRCLRYYFTNYIQVRGGGYIEATYAELYRLVNQFLSHAQSKGHTLHTPDYMHHTPIFCLETEYETVNKKNVPIFVFQFVSVAEKRDFEAYRNRRIRTDKIANVLGG
jgi:hypothetical protein